MGEWAHEAITEKRDGSIRLYVNGMLTGEGERYRREHTLNNSTYLSLFADAFEYAPIEAAVDELKIGIIYLHSIYRPFIIVIQRNSPFRINTDSTTAIHMGDFF